MENIIKTLREKKPLVHCITNYVTVNDCANVLLAIGASPIMSDEEKDVEDIVSICSALVINIGTLNQRTVKSMLLAGKKANKLGIPVVLDPVGNGASKFRTETTNTILKEIKLAAIKGNISEIKMIYSGIASTRGVDAGLADKDTIENKIKIAQELSKKIGCIIAITGKTDVVADGKLVYTIDNGSAKMGNITGAGCMCTCLVGSFLGAFDNKLEATVSAIAVMGIAGELADKQNIGTGSFRTGLIDQLSWMDDKIFNDEKKIFSK